MAMSASWQRVVVTSSVTGFTARGRCGRPASPVPPSARSPPRPAPRPFALTVSPFVTLGPTSASASHHDVVFAAAWIIGLAAKMDGLEHSSYLRQVFRVLAGLTAVAPSRGSPLSAASSALPCRQGAVCLAGVKVSTLTSRSSSDPAATLRLV